MTDRNPAQAVESDASETAESGKATQSGNESNGKEQFCPWCEDFTYQVIIQYEPEPNDAQIEAEDIPTDEIQLVAGNLCCNCGDLITAHVAEATREVDTGTDRSDPNHESDAREQ